MKFSTRRSGSEARSFVCVQLSRSTGTGGFTLVEMLVVIAIIALLVTLIFAGTSTSIDRAKTTRCKSHMRQWGVALLAYATDHKGKYPDNRDGADLSFLGAEATRFSDEYLAPLGYYPDNRAKDGGDAVQFCPFQEWHRNAARNWVPPRGAQDGQLILGYFFLPYRSHPFAPTGCDYSPGNAEWVTRQRPGTRVHNAPILTDMIQSNGGQWKDTATGIPYSSHTHRDGTPKGGHFLFEDGHVRWIDMDEIELGAQAGGWGFHYKIPL